MLSYDYKIHIPPPKCKISYPIVKLTGTKLKMYSDTVINSTVILYTHMNENITE